MTAGIGILNRNGVALASDSFGEIDIYHKKKFISVERIFSLSKNHSVGILISNLVSLMSIPWETTIKAYRSYIGDKHFDTLQEYSEDFIKFLSNDKRFTDPVLEVYIIYNALDYCISEVTKSAKIIGDYEKAISDEIEKKVDFFAKEKFLDGFDDNFIKYFIEKHGKDLEQYIKIKPECNFDIKTQQNLIKMCAYVISKSNFIFENYSRTGLAFLGYGDKEIFPAIYTYEIWAIVDRNLIYKFTESNHIGVDNRLKIYSFGETDVVRTFMGGINPDFKDKIFEAIEYSFIDCFSIMKNKYIEAGIQHKLSNKEKEIISSSGKSAMSDFIKKVNDIEQKEYLDQFNNMIQMLNKREMVSLAETLVNLTIAKQRFSTDEQNVGGTIDVAIITKGDGLSWIKRKQYYNAELNY